MMKQKKSKQNQSNEELACSGVTTDLKNCFHDKLVRNTFSLREIADRYHRMFHPIANDIENILEETISFRSATDLDFNYMREQAVSDKNILDTLNAIGNAINTFATKYNSQTLSVNEKKIVDDALDYCKKSILERLEKLNQNKDRIYRLYQKNENELKNVLLK
jgi:hypothetical protein